MKKKSNLIILTVFAWFALTGYAQDNLTREEAEILYNQICRNPSTDPTLIPTCNTSGSGTLDLEYTDANAVRLKIKGNAAKTLYVHLLYWLEIEPDYFTADRQVNGKLMTCQRNDFDYECEMYYSNDYRDFIYANYFPFDSDITGRVIGNGVVDSSDIIVQLPRGKLEKFEIKFKGQASKSLFDILSRNHGKRPTEDLRVDANDPILSVPNRYTTIWREVYCFNNPRGDRIAECRLILNSQIAFPMRIPADSDLVYGTVGVTIIPNLIGVWNGGRVTQEVPEE